MPRHFPNWLKAYSEFTSNSEAPYDMHFWVGVSTVAGALRRRVWIDQRQYQWTPNFYVVLVAPPGVATKSTTIRVGHSLLRQVEGIHFGPDSLTWQALAESLADSQDLVPLDNTIPIESQEFLSMSCITCSVKELGTFLDPQDSKMMSVFTHLWDGQVEPFTHATKTQGTIHVENPWINIISATTPAWLQANMPKEIIGGGLASRMVFVYAETKEHLIAYPSRLSRASDYYEMEEKLAEDLQRIATLVGEYRLPDKVMDYGTKWYEDFWRNRPTHLASERFGGYISRKKTHVHKVAMVLAACKRDELVITLEDLKEAIALVTKLERDMLAVFQSIVMGSGMGQDVPIA